MIILQIDLVFRSVESQFFFYRRRYLVNVFNFSFSAELKVQAVLGKVAL